MPFNNADALDFQFVSGTNLTWPDEGSALDDVFQLYNETQQRKGYVMIAASMLFWASLILDFVSFWSDHSRVKALSVIGSRVVNFIGSLFVFASVILVGLPDYLEASNLDKICPYCGEDFNRTVKQVRAVTNTIQLVLGPQIEEKW